MQAAGQFVVAGVTVSYSRSSRRRRALLRVERDEVQLRMPMRYAIDRGRELVAANIAWVKDRLREAAAVPAPVFRSGGHFLYLGDRLTLEVQADDKPGCELKRDWLVVRLPAKDAADADRKVRGILECWYKRQARQVIGQRVELLARRTGKSPDEVRIGRSRTAWGTCIRRSARGVPRPSRLRFTWRLLKAPLALVDSVVIHELCHLWHPDHSPRFWALVDSHDPDRVANDRRLNELTQRLMSW